MLVVPAAHAKISLRHFVEKPSSQQRKVLVFSIAIAAESKKWKPAVEQATSNFLSKAEVNMP